jgi:multidrug resistance efflux pump
MTNEQDTKQQNNDAQQAIKKGSAYVAAAILLSLSWYLMADRFTPVTDQARIQGYVIGVAPKVSGLVTDVLVSNNQIVSKDQLLFTIDTEQYAIAQQKAGSDFDNARKQVQAGDAVVISARANLEAARANELKAAQDLTRLDRLYKQDSGAISKRRLEVSQATLAQAKAQVKAAEADIQRAIEQNGGDNFDENTVIRAAQSALDKARLDLQNAEVKASTAGVITDLRTDVGQFASTGTPVMTLISTHDLWINAEYTENNLGHLKPDTPVEILFDALPGRVYKGKIRSVGAGISTGQNQQPGTLPSIDNNRDWLRQSQRFPVIIDFEPLKQNELSGHLRLGGQATVIAYTDGHLLLKLIGKAYIRLISFLSYAY